MKNINNFAFIDSQNLNLGVQSAGFKIDWRKFRKFLKDRYQVQKAYMFIGYVYANEDLYDYMQELGYTVILKPTINIKSYENNQDQEVHTDDHHADQDDKNKQNIKGNIDADLVLHVMKELNNFDQAVIVSGDGDFYSLIEYLIEVHKLKNIMTPNWKSSTLLKQFDDYIVRLDQFKRQLSYKNHRLLKKKTV
jgi:uncharacterized LabA/DUF88 family protein